MAESLRSKTLKGTMWAALQRFGVMIISFASNMVLARLLLPSDFGAIAMLAVFLVVADTFMDGGVGSAIIQKKNIRDEDKSTAFLFNVGVALLLYIVIWFSALPIADFYSIPSLLWILRIEAIVLVINSFGVVQMCLLRKNLDFKYIAKANIIASILGVATAIISAYMGCGVWSLVLQQIVLSAVRVSMLWSFNKWHPRLIWSKKSFKELFGFGSYIFLGNLINNIGNKIQGVVIGKAFNASILGYYTQAKNLEDVASQSISGIIDQVSYPALAAKQHDPEGMVKVIRKMLRSISFVTMPLMVLLSLVGAQVITLCYGAKWETSIPYFRILCFAGIAVSLQGISYYSIAAIGMSKILFKWTVIKRMISIALLLIGPIWGMRGLLVAVVISAYNILFINALQVQKYLKYSVIRQIIDLFPITGLTIISAILAIALSLTHSVGFYLEGIERVIIFLMVYLFGAYLIKLDCLRDVRDLIMTIIRKK